MNRLIELNKLNKRFKIESLENTVKLYGPLGSICLSGVGEPGLYTLGSTTHFRQHSSTLLLSYLNQSIKGVCVGFSRQLVLRGIGFRSWRSNNGLFLDLGFSHYAFFPISSDVIFFVRKTKILFFSIFKQKLTFSSSMVKEARVPDVYKSKGIAYQGEKLISKVGKKR